MIILFIMLFIVCLSILKFFDNLVVFLPAQTIEEHDAGSNNPQYSWHCAEGMMNHFLDGLLLLDISLIASPSHY